LLLGGGGDGNSWCCRLFEGKSLEEAGNFSLNCFFHDSLQDLVEDTCSLTAFCVGMAFEQYGQRAGIWRGEFFFLWFRTPY